MLIKSTRIQSSSGPKALINHVFDKAEENEEIRVIYGDRSVVESMMQTASAMDKKYGVRHFTISSFESLTDEKRQEARQLIADEYGFNLDDCVVVRHMKARENNAGDEQHEHLLVPEIQANGRVLDNRANRLRNEKISRQFEIQNGFRIVPGKWNQSVTKAFAQAGQHDFANQMAEACQIERPGAAFSSSKHQEMKRKGKSMPHIKTDINNIWSQSDGIKAFLSAMSDRGFRIEQGTKNKKSYIIYDEDNTQISSVSRILKDVRQNDFFIMMEDFNNGIIRKEEKTAVRQSTKKAVGGLIKKSTKQEADDYADEGLESFREFPVFRAEEENGNAESDLLRSEISPRGNIADSGTDTENTNGRAEPDRADTREPKSDITEPAGINESNVRHAQHVIASAKIKFHFSNTVEIRDISHVRPLTPEYIQEIKERVKSYGKDDKEYFMSIYQNLKEQNREIYKYNKSIDHDVISLIIDAIMRLLFGVSIRQGKAMPEPVTYPRFESPVDKQTFDSMSKQDKKSIVFLTFVKLRASYTKHDNFMKKFDMDGRYPSFQAFLQSFSGDYMADEIINMYPQKYIKEMEKSENEMDREVAIELKKIMKNESSDYPYSHEDLKMFINSISGEIENNKKLEIENQKINEELNRQMAQFYEAYGDNITSIANEKTIERSEDNIIEIGNHFRR